jgi:hypothetical protein
VLAMRMVADVDPLRDHGQIEIAGRSSESFCPQLFEFVVARVAKAVQQINRTVHGHFTQFDEAPARFQIGVQDFSGDFFGTVHHRS